MTWRILTDDPSYFAVLVSDDPFYALGPALESDGDGEAYEALSAFAAACDPPPDQMPTVQLITEWQSFVQALAAMQLDALQGDQEGRSDPFAPIPGQTSIDEAAALSGPESAPGMPPDHAVEPWSEDHATAAEAAAAGDVHAQEAVAQSPAPPPDCWRCGGTKLETVAGVQVPCSICQLTADPASVS